MIGVIGVGLLGSAVARRLMARGFEVRGCDPDPKTAEIPMAASNAELARSCERLVLCLPHSGVTSGVLAEIGDDVLVIDMTTGDPGQMAAFGGGGRAYLDATIVGSSRQVEAGDGVILAGGAAEHFQAAKPVLDTLAARVFHTGPCGSGAQWKLVVNLVLGLNRAAFAEGLAFAEACGLDLPQAVEILKATPAYSRAMDVKGAKMLAREYSPDARLRQHHKDVRLILDAAQRRGLTLPFSETHDRVLTAAEEAGLGELDNSAVFEALRLKHL